MSGNIAKSQFIVSRHAGKAQSNRGRLPPRVDVDVRTSKEEANKFEANARCQRSASRPTLSVDQLYTRAAKTKDTLIQFLSVVQIIVHSLARLQISIPSLSSSYVFTRFSQAIIKPADSCLYK